MSKKNKTQTPETLAVKLMAQSLLKMLKKPANEGMDIYNDRKTAKALMELRSELNGWGLD